MKQEFNPNLIPENVKLIIFDCDGTLVETMDEHTAAWNSIFKRFNIEVEREFLDSFASAPSSYVAEIVFKKYGIEVNPSLVAEEKENLYFDSLKRLSPIPRTISYVKNYHRKIPMIVVSGGGRRGVDKSLELIELREYFDQIITADDQYPPKTDPKVFKIIAEEYGVRAGQVVVFEDGEIGIRSALAAGMMVVDVRDEILKIKM